MGRVRIYQEIIMASVVSSEVAKIGPDHAGELVSAEEFATADFAEPFRYERVKGRLVVMAPAGPEHRGTSRSFRLELGAYWGAHRDLVEDVDVEGWVATSEDDDRIPDICVYLKPKGKRPQEQVPQRVPDMIFEFVSSSRADQERDYIDKREEYHKIGVKEYVIVDRLKHSVLVLTWAKSDYREKRLAKDDVYTTPLLPGLKVPLSPVFGGEVV
jgi:Uma2 family endonuclease